MSGQSAETIASRTSYKEALAWLFSTQLFGIKLGLENIQRLLQELALPAAEQRIIHVAGTNGKGSVCAMLESICRAAGYRTGMFTSPHLVTFRERIQVDGFMISETAVADGLTSLGELIATWDPHPTFFEITTALALQQFKKAHCEIVILETGMGGRLDATNAVQPVISVLTPIDLDHQKWLGHTLSEIAQEKAGIIKPRVPVVSAAQSPEVAAVIRARAQKVAAPIEFVSQELANGLAGAHQKQNAALAVAALRAANIHVDQRAISDGLANVTWPARFQRWNDRLIIDGAHNPAGALVLAQTWRGAFGDEKALIILAVLQDKDAAAILQALAPIANGFLFPRIHSERALSPDELAAIVKQAAPNAGVSIVASTADGLERAEVSGQRALITGSLHFAGEALAELRGEASQFEGCLQ